MTFEGPKEEILHKMRINGIYGDNSIKKADLVAWFPTHRQGEVKKAVDELLNGKDWPIVPVGENRLKLDEATIPDGYDNIAERYNWTGRWEESDIAGIRSEEIEDNTYKLPEDRQEEERSLEEINKDLLNQVREGNEAAESWHAEVRRRQRISIIVAIVSFIVGAGVTVGIQFLV